MGKSKKITDILKEIELHEKAIEALKEIAVKTCGFAEGDKVRVWEDLHGRMMKPIDCFIGKIWLGYDGLEYEFKPVKKDGNPSKQNIRIWDIGKMEKIKPPTDGKS